MAGQPSKNTLQRLLLQGAMALAGVFLGGMSIWLGVAPALGAEAYREARAALEANDTPEAVRLFERSIRIDPGQSRGYLALAALYYQRFLAPELARQEAAQPDQILAALDPESALAGPLDRPWAGEILRLLRQGEGHIADPLLYELQARGHMALHQWDEAEQALGRALLFDRGNRRLQRELARCDLRRGLTALDRGDPATAAERLARGLARDTGNSGLLTARGWLALENGDIEEALEDFRRALDRDALSVAGRLGLASALARSGDGAEAARQAWKLALRLQPIARREALAMRRLCRLAQEDLPVDVPETLRTRLRCPGSASEASVADLVAESSDPVVMLHRARQAYAAQEYAECLAIAQEILTTEPRHFEALRLRALALERSGGQATELAEAYAALERLRPPIALGYLVVLD